MPCLKYVLLLCIGHTLLAEETIRITDVQADNLIGIDLAFDEVLKEFKAIKVGPGKRVTSLKNAGKPRLTGKPMVHYNIAVDGKKYGYHRGLGTVTHFDRKWTFTVWSVHDGKDKPKSE